VSSPPGIRLETSRDGARANLRIEIPPVNVLDVGALGELARQVVAARMARVLVLTGLPKAFSAGVNMADHLPDPVRIDRMLSAMRGVLVSLVETPAITLAAVSGACLGGGAEILLACDLVLVAEDARVGFPEIRLACFPPGAAALLPGRIGEARAAEWILSGKTHSGKEAAEAGLASRAVPAERLARETEWLAESLSTRAAGGLSCALEVLRKTRREALEQRLPAAEEAYRKLAGSEDLARAVRGFPRSRR
jgi:cyclohexa-1,5-dienecarbonyl-CoA hydratase